MLPKFSEKMDIRSHSDHTSNTNRLKRSLEKVAVPRLVEMNKRGVSNNENSQQTKRVVTLDCDLGTAKCLKITCALHHWR